MRAQHGSSSDPDPGASPSLPAEWAIDTDALNAAALGLLVDEPGASAEAGDSAIFARNLEAIALRSPRIAKRLSDAAPRRDITFVDTADEVPSATLASPSGVIALASKRRPLAEAGTIAASVDIEDHGGIVVLGFALGYHARAIAERIGKHGVVIVYEPDLALLRAVLERVDHSDWIRETATCFLCDENASGEMSALTKGLEAPLSIGIELVEHAPSRARLGDRAAVFGSTFAEVVNAMRTQVITTLMQSDVTLRNVLMNAEHYVTRPGIADLKDAAKGRAAVVVSAGPSLERNLHLLADQEFRSRAVVIAVQTVLRPMLSAGVRPDFVTALDYHEISTRFYEGLTRDDLEGITLVAEPKVNPAVLDAFPGDIRLVTDEVLEQVFGPTRTADDALTPGATVAHLAYYLARHLGCDPAILIGQDLGFTDGQYYASGAAIHDVWAPELNAFRTIEMFEWERIARGKTKLIERTDHLGRPIYTDQQMATYLAQFEREFSADVDAGRTIIDATEGGVAKRGTTASTLAEALEQHAAADRSPIELPPVSTASRERPPELRGTLETIRSGSRAIAQQPRDAETAPSHRRPAGQARLYRSHQLLRPPDPHHPRRGHEDRAGLLARSAPQPDRHLPAIQVRPPPPPQPADHRDRATEAPGRARRP
ncbi:MAG: motility associated factor glycosyltransferase family protein [Phycisphaerales bacterium]